MSAVIKWPAVIVGMAIAAGCSAPPNTAQPSDSSADPSTSSITEPIAESGAPIVVDGSSTVYPLTDEVAQELKFEQGEEAPTVLVDFSGTGGGFTKFCAGETDINNASRPISTEEIETCRENGIEFIELPVAFDALTVVVNPDNDWAEDITVDELKTMWEPAAEGTITNWNQIRSDWPDRPFNLHGADVESGTYDYFTEAIVGESGASRTDYTDQVDDENIVRAVRQDPDALGYFGYAYYEANERTLKALAIDNGDGPVMPSSETVSSGDYAPLARPLFIYVNAEAAQQKPELRDFVTYYLNNARFLAKVVGYVPLPNEAYNIATEHFTNNRVGTVFEGEPVTNLTIEELLRKEAEF